MATALKYFGGLEKAFETISLRIHEARQKSEFRQPEELGIVANLSRPIQVDDLEQRRASPDQFSVSEVLAISSQLGLTVESLLPFREDISGEEKSFWDSERKQCAGPVAGINGECGIDPDTARNLFIRFQALQELFTKPPERLVRARRDTAQVHTA